MLTVGITVVPALWKLNAAEAAAGVGRETADVLTAEAKERYPEFNAAARSLEAAVAVRYGLVNCALALCPGFWVIGPDTTVSRTSVP